MNPDILITGASGFVGAHLCAAFRSQGQMVIEVTRGTDLNIIDWHNIRLVIHCASQQPRKGLSVGDYEAGNVDSLRAVLKMVKKFSVQNVVHFSTASVYADQGEQVIDELSSVSPMGDYAATKWKSEKVLEEAASEGSFSAICFRMPSVFGVGHQGGLIYTYCELARKNEIIEVFSEGRLLRGLLYIDDVVRACLQIQSMSSLPAGFNLFLLGASNVLPMAAIARHIIRAVGSRSDLRLVKRESPVNFHWNLSTSKFQKFFKIQPLTIEEGVNHYIAKRGLLNVC